MWLPQPVHALPERLAQLIWGWALAWWRIVYLGAVVLVLVLSPSSYSRVGRHLLARRMYLDTLPILLEMVIRVLVLELIPLTAAMFVAMRCAIPSGAQLAQLRRSGRLVALERSGADPVRM